MGVEAGEVLNTCLVSVFLPGLFRENVIATFVRVHISTNSQPTAHILSYHAGKMTELLYNMALDENEVQHVPRGLIVLFNGPTKNLSDILKRVKKREKAK